MKFAHSAMPPTLQINHMLCIMNAVTLIGVLCKNSCNIHCCWECLMLSGIIECYVEVHAYC